MNIIFKPQNYSPLTKNSHSQLLPESSRDRAGELMVPAQESSKHSSRQTKPTFCHSPSGLIPLASSASQMLDCRLIVFFGPSQAGANGGGSHQHTSPAHRWADPTTLQQDHVSLTAYQQNALINSWVSFPPIQPQPFCIRVIPRLVPRQ